MRTLSHHHKHTVKILTVTSCKLNCHDLFSCYAVWVFFSFSVAMDFFLFVSVFIGFSRVFLLSFNLELSFSLLFSFNRLFSSFFYQNGSVQSFSYWALFSHMFEISFHSTGSVFGLYCNLCLVIAQEPLSISLPLCLYLSDLLVVCQRLIPDFTLKDLSMAACDQQKTPRDYTQIAVSIIIMKRIKRQNHLNRIKTEQIQSCMLS